MRRSRSSLGRAGHGKHRYHYQLEPRIRMTVAAFKGALDNMARAAVAHQCEVARK